MAERAIQLQAVAPLRVFSERALITAVNALITNQSIMAGDSLDGMMTGRALKSVGVLSLLPGGGYAAANPAPATSIPPAPANLSVIGSFTLMHLSWNAPDYRGHAYTEIWRAGVDDIGQATRVGTQPHGVGLYGDTVPEGSTFYYWIRYVSTSNNAGAFNAVGGVVGQTTINAAYLIAGIEGQITESELYAGLNSRINLIDTPITGLVARVTTAEGAILSNSSSITTLTSSLATTNSNVSANSTAISGLDTRVTSNEGVITSHATAISALESSVNNPVTGLTSKAAITYVDSTVASEASARASSDSTLQTSINGNTATIATHATSLNGINAQYTIKLDVNGKVSGIGLMNDGATSEFGILADKFWISNGADSYGTAKVPFSVVGGITYLKSAFIQDASITNAKIDTVAAGKITAGTIDATISMTAPIITGGTIIGTTITGGTLRTAASGARFEASQTNNNAAVYGDRGDGVVDALLRLSYGPYGTPLAIGSAANIRPSFHMYNNNTTLIGGDYFSNYGWGRHALTCYYNNNSSGVHEDSALRASIVNPNAWQAAVRGESDWYGIGLEGTSSDAGAQLRLSPGGVVAPTHGCISGAVYMGYYSDMHVNKGGSAWGKVIDTRATMTDWNYLGLPGFARWTPTTPGSYTFVCTNQSIRLEVLSGGAWRLSSNQQSHGQFHTSASNVRIYNPNAAAADIYGVGIIQ